jgi:threonine dehydrogenase-like Zn-dependent dehydrogenase
MLPCAACRACLSGDYRLCSGRRGLSAYGYRGTDEPPSLWGGYAQYMYLAPQTVLHPIATDVPAEVAVMFNPLGAGIRWAVQLPGTSIGDTVVILGPGQRGLCSVIACKEAGAACVIVTGLESDAHKLELARSFGADHTIDVSSEDPVRRVRDITDGRGADIVVDVTAYATEPVAQALDMVKRGGTIVLAGTKGTNPIPHFLSDKIVTRELTIKGALGVDFHAYEPAIRLIESGKYPLERMHTHSFGLEQAERAIRVLAGEVEGERAIHVALVP